MVYSFLLLCHTRIELDSKYFSRKCKVQQMLQCQRNLTLKETEVYSTGTAGNWLEKPRKAGKLRRMFQLRTYRIVIAKGENSACQCHCGIDWDDLVCWKDKGLHSSIFLLKILCFDTVSCFVGLQLGTCGVDLFMGGIFDWFL